MCVQENAVSDGLLKRHSRILAQEAILSHALAAAAALTEALAPVRDPRPRQSAHWDALEEAQAPMMRTWIERTGRVRGWQAQAGLASRLDALEAEFESKRRSSAGGV
jgi:hypothetical protein